MRADGMKGVMVFMVDVYRRCSNESLAASDVTKR